MKRLFLLLLLAFPFARAGVSTEVRLELVIRLTGDAGPLAVCHVMDLGGDGRWMPACAGMTKKDGLLPCEHLPITR